MAKSQQRPADTGDAAGLRCWKCRSRQFRVIYTRPCPNGGIMRRRACRQCGTKITTRERMIGA